MKKSHLDKFLALACLALVQSSCKASGGGSGKESNIDFSCQYSLVKSDQELLKQAREKASAGENLESLLKHAENCLAEVSGS